ncbi:hypothetical protein MCHLDSM_04390 [Mycolicibacterium chlorophenolicum]|uniref:Uncharacterized protein n=2 Tax=Mycolicibacterium chlorophenolicum TaxID=37916 RepID=A0A0J6VQP0_9MYCO|nr:hypothetical protein MCHLDSM_04390 [Mycolicibacterium chlorophenolicum]
MKPLSVMMDADRVAWQLAEEMRDRLPEEARVTMYCTLGTGDTFDAVTAIMELAVRHQQTVAHNTVRQLHAWLDGYRGNPDEPRMRAAIHAITP